MFLVSLLSLERSILSGFCSLELLIVKMYLNLIWASIYLCIFSITINYVILKSIYITSIHIKIIFTKIRFSHIFDICIKNLLHFLRRFRIYLIHSSSLFSQLWIIFKLHIIKQIACPIL
nr:MAG TPA: hypothetical protein [Caudoviricetes sp.]